MAGFLDDVDVQIMRGDENVNKKTTVRSVLTCALCSEKCIGKHRKLPVWGQGKKRILFVLDTPSIAEAEAGKPWRGDYGKAVREELEHDLQIDFEKDCWTVFAVRCKRTDKSPNAADTAACRKRLHADIENLNPAVIVPFGYWAMIGVSGDILSNKLTGKGSGDWAGAVIPDQRWLKWIVPTWETFWLNLFDRIPDPVYRMQMVDHIKKAIELSEKKIPVKSRNDEKRINVIYDEKEAVTLIEKLIETAPEYLTFDYETTGRKPYRAGHRIYSAALSNGKQAWAFPFFDSAEFRQVWRRLMRHPRIKWIAHNAKFEWIWTKVILKYWPKNLAADTMLGAKVINNNQRVGLKSLVYCNFGVAGYDDAVEKYLETPSKEEAIYGSNGFNLIDQAPVEKVLEYNAYDTLYTFWLWELWEKELIKKLQVGYKFFSQSSIHLARAEVNGMLIDLPGVEIEKRKIQGRQEQLLEEMQAIALENGWKQKYNFRPSASADISHLLYDLMGYKPSRETKNGKATDKAELEKIDEPVVKKILEWKQFDKLRGTYLDGVSREVVNGKINPFFNLHIVISYRSSSDSPNFQNFPKRNKVVSRIIRSLLKPHPGQRLVEYDYKGIEVAVSACYNKDPNLIKYITDPTTDMHRDTGEELFMFKRGELSSADRHCAKNMFVFPEFYGSWFRECAKNLWENCSKEAHINLDKNGVRHFSDFEEHVCEIEKDFWDKRFPVYKQWKKDIYNRYLQKGYVESYTGFRYFGPMKKNEACNYQIQGSAFHCMLRTFGRLSEIIEKEHLQSKLVGQIHDSAIPSVDPDEETYLDYIMWYEGTQKIREDWDWILVPLSIEKSYGEIDGNWANMTTAGLLNEQVSIIKV